MKIASLNISINGSTGKIMLQLADLARSHGHLCQTYAPVVFTRGKRTVFQSMDNHFWWGTRAESCFHYYVGALLGRNGCFSQRGTRQLIRDLQAFRPDVIHLHNIHAFCINLPMLFRYIKKNNIRVIWTLHDCWAFTGHCPHFTLAKCERWKEGCHHCPQPRIYPKMYLDTSRWMYKRKKRWFTGVRDMTLVTPSQWLADLVGQSFLKESPVVIIHNGIDLSVFHPTENEFRKKYGISDKKKILLGVSFGWGMRKGLDVFIELSKRLDSEKYQIVLVGTNENVDKQLPANIISIHCTADQKELAEIYTAADLFINPTREDTYPTVNMESIACGTPVLTFRTGGSPEIVDETCGAVVDCDDIDAMEREVIRICDQSPFSVEACLSKAKAFDKNAKFEEYIKLYENRAHSFDGPIY